MPVHIYRIAPEGGKSERIAWLCADCWSLPEQAEALESWLAERGGDLPPDHYIPDIGFMLRNYALGGGAAISQEAMRTMADLGMWLYISEYPGGDSEST